MTSTNLPQQAPLRHWRRGTQIAGALIMLVATTVQPQARTSAAFPGTLVLQDGKLMARVSAVSLQQVLEELGRLSGARVRWLGPKSDTAVSADFTELSLPEALRRLLGERNFMLFYSPSGEDLRLARIWVSSHPTIAQPLFSSSPMQTGQSPPPGAAPSALVQTALSGASIEMRLRALWGLRRYSAKDPRIRGILSQIARNAANPPRVRSVASHILSQLK